MAFTEFPIPTVAASMTGAQGKSSVENAKALFDSKTPAEIVAGVDDASAAISHLANLDSLIASQYGLTLDGVTDNLTSLQSMCDEAQTNGKKVVIDGPLYVSDTVTATVDIEFTGDGYLVYTTQTNPLLHLTTNNVGEVIAPLTVTGLTELSSTVGGFTPQPNGFAVIESTEELINRIGGLAYTKNELIVFSDDTGNLAVPVYEDYISGSITSVTYYPPEKPLVIKSLKINTSDSSPVTATVEGLVKVSLRNVISDTPSILNVENTQSNWLNEKVPNATMLNPIINGSKLVNGYGVRNTITGGCQVINPQIANCRRGIVGRHDKNTFIMGGFVSETIDSHYGYNMQVGGGAVISGDIRFAGRDISVMNITHKNTIAGIVQRNDTPETKGIMKYESNNIIITTTDEYAGIIIGAASTFDFGRTLHQPELISFKKNVFELKAVPSTLRYVNQIQSTACDMFRVKNIEVGGNILSNLTITPQAVSFVNKTDNMLGDYNTSITYENEKLGAIYAQDLTAAFDSTWGFDFTIRNIKDLVLRVDSTALSSGTIRDSKVTRITNNSASDLSANVLGVWDIKDTDIRGINLENHKHILACDGYFELMPDDTAQKINLLPYKQYGRITVFVENNIGRTGEAIFDAGTSIGIINVATGASFESNTVVLTGTTGTDGRLTVSVVSGALYIENRSGGTKNIFYSIR